MEELPPIPIHPKHLMKILLRIPIKCLLVNCLNSNLKECLQELTTRAILRWFLNYKEGTWTILRSSDSSSLISDPENVWRRKPEKIVLLFLKMSGEESQRKSYCYFLIFMRHSVSKRAYYGTREGTCEFYFLTCSDDSICCSNDLISCLHNLSSC